MEMLKDFFGILSWFVVTIIALLILVIATPIYYSIIFLEWIWKQKQERDYANN